MAWENWTVVTEFVFKGFSDHPDLQVTLFVVFLLIYVFTVVGNLGIIAIVWFDSQLQTPMYFFLSNLSFLDLCYSSVVMPKMMLDLLSERKTSFVGCFVQLYFYVAFAIVECYLLAVMAYDCYVAIRNPLLYPVVMSQKVCTSLLAVSYVVGFFNSMVLTGFALVSFCGPNVIDHFFCDGPQLSKLACLDTRLNQVLLFAFGGFNEVTTVSAVLISYGRILFTILRMGSMLGKRKAFGICASHLVVVTIFYGTILFMYLRPSSSYSMGRDKITSVFYSVVTPMLNPFIYSLRNQEVKNALKREVGRTIISLLKWQAMAEQNCTSVTEFILEGLSDQAEMKAALFVLFLLIYTITLLGNAGIIIVIRGDPRLHTSMYFFLGSLSIVDICFSSVIAPRTLANFLLERKTISFIGCMGQAAFYIVFVTTECFLLAAMAYDRYVAICNPLLYSSVMTGRLCTWLVVGSYLGGVLNSIIQMTFIIRLPFCSSNVINHFFCDVPPLLALSCASTYTNEMILFSLAGVIELSTIVTILVSYIFISFAILRIHSAEGRQKAFSTCASHLTAVTMLYGTTIFMYLRPSSSYSPNTDKVVSVFYTVAVPMLNPLIYSLRNQEVKDALRRTAERITVRL
ncbi:LOW QUALITY PROTEIN: uncharacterized protein VSU04_005523 [Chlamydotis macqueenii]